MDDPGFRDAFRDYVFPPRSTGQCDEWCAPLHMVERAIAGAEFAQHFNVDDFMIMAAFRRRGKPLLYLYKHGFTRRYLNVDTAGVAWRYVAPTTDSPTDRGRYVRLSDLRLAIEALDLWMLPDMAGWSDDVDADNRYPS